MNAPDSSESSEPPEPPSATTTEAATAEATRAALETDVPEGLDVVRCAYCDRPFVTESYLVLHHGLAHPESLSAAEREAFRDAYEEENADLRRFRVVALGLLVLLYFGFLFTFAVVT